VSAYAPDGVPEVTAGADLVALLLPLVDLHEGDVVAVTSKVVAKAEGRVVPGERDALLAGETERVVARRGPTAIVRTRHGLTLAAAGIDASNVAQGYVVLLPEDPDASARAIRRGLADRTGRNVGVVVTDTAGRAWREGQTDIAIGAAGLRVAEEYAGRVDAHGNELAVTAPAVADEIAGLAELAQGKLGGRPFAVVRGRADLVLPPDEDGPGAAALIRPEGADLFGYGAREAVLRAARGEPADAAPFGSPAPRAELLEALASAGLSLSRAEDLPAVRIVAFAHGWQADRPSSGEDVGLRPITP
jgi:coenzyme F420-0:L-glutamate ligase / coenzyme F420-1:gamma-L-glutamate ligase